MPFDQLGKLLLVLGAAVVVIGLVFWLLGRLGLSRLPGDINITAGNFTCVAPIVTMLLLSLLLTIIVNIVLRIFNR